MSITIDPLEVNALELERMRVKELQPQIAPSPLVTLASPLSPVSTLAPVEKTEAPSPKFRPQIEHPALPSLRVYQKAEASGTRQAQIFDGQVTTDLATIDKLNDEKEAAINDFIEKEKARKTWGMLSTVMQYLASATSAILGIACIASGQVVPGVLMVSGAVGGIVHKMAVDMDVYQKVAAWFSKSVETQSKIARRMEMGGFLLTLTASLAGGFWAYNAGALSSQLLTGSRLVQGLQTGTNLMGAGFRVKEGYLQKQIAEVQNKMKQLELEADMHYQNIDENNLNAKKMIEKLADIGRQLKTTIQICGRAAEAA